MKTKLTKIFAALTMLFSLVGFSFTQATAADFVVKPTLQSIGMDGSEPLPLIQDGNNYSGNYTFDETWATIVYLALECDPTEAGATIYYTWDGTTPNENSVRYGESNNGIYQEGKGVSVVDFRGYDEPYVNPVVVKAIAIKDGESSEVITVTLTEGSATGDPVLPVYEVTVWANASKTLPFTKNGNSSMSLEAGDGSGIYEVENVPETGAYVAIYEEKGVASTAYYTTDGSEPTKAGSVFDLTKWDAKINIVFAEGSDEFVLRMLAFNDDRAQDSSFMTLTCKKEAPAPIELDAPVFDPNGGVVLANTAVTLTTTSTATGTSIFYAFAEEKNSEGILYQYYTNENKPKVTAERLRLWAFVRTGIEGAYNYSDTVKAEYTIKPVVSPKLQKQDGENLVSLDLDKDGNNYSGSFTYDNDHKVYLALESDPAAGTDIHYTTDGSTPSAASAKYGEANSDIYQAGKGISVCDLYGAQTPHVNPVLVKAVAIKDGVASDIITLTLTESTSIAVLPVFNVTVSAESGLLEFTKNGNSTSIGGDGSGIYVVEDVPATGAYVMAFTEEGVASQGYYTTDGSKPTKASRVFDFNKSGEKIDIVFAEGSNEFVVRMLAFNKDRAQDSSFMTLTCKKADPRPKAPVFDPDGGAVAANTAVSLTSTTEGADIFYAFAEEKNGEGVNYQAYNEENKPQVTAENLTLWAFARTGAEGAYLYSDTVKAEYTLIDKLELKPTLHVYMGLDNYNYVFDTLELTQNGNNYSGYFKFDPDWGKMVWLSLECDPEEAEADIYYTRDGTTPTAESIKYATADDDYYQDGKGISISDFYYEQNRVNPVVVKAIAMKDGVVSEVITLTLREGTAPIEPKAVPVFNVMVSTPTQNFEFTQNGNSATAMEPGDGSGIYEVEDVPALAARVVVYDEADVASKAYYTTDGSEPTKASSVFDLTDIMAKIDIVFAEGSDEFVLRMLAFNDDRPQDSSFMMLTCKKSDESIHTNPEAPVFDPAGGAVEEYTEITLTSATEGAWIYYAFAEEKEGEGVTYEQYYLENQPIVTKENLKLWAFARTTFEGIHFYSDTVMAEYTIKQTANEGEELAGVRVYPNPSEGEFHVVVPVDAELEVFAMDGRRVFYKTVEAGENTIRMENAGAYLVRVSANGQATIKKLIIM